MARMSSPRPGGPAGGAVGRRLRALLKACEGSELRRRRDTAIVRLFIDTGARLSEMAGLKLDDVDLDDQTLTVMGKGSRGRVLPFGAKTARRSTATSASDARTELAACGSAAKGPMGTSGIQQMLRRRAARPASTTSTRTCSGTPSLTTGSPPRGRGRPDGDRRLAVEGDAAALRRRPEPTSPGGSSPPESGGPAVTPEYLEALHGGAPPRTDRCSLPSSAGRGTDDAARLGRVSLGPILVTRREVFPARPMGPGPERAAVQRCRATSRRPDREPRRLPIRPPRPARGANGLRVPSAGPYPVAVGPLHQPSEALRSGPEQARRSPCQRGALESDSGRRAAVADMTRRRNRRDD